MLAQMNQSTTRPARRAAASLAFLALITAAPAALLAQPANTAAPAAASQPAADLPSAKAITDRFIEVTGGRAAYEKLTNRTATGKFEIPQMGLSAKLRMVQAAPNKMRFIVEADNIGTIDSGTNGDLAWETSQMTGPRILTDAEREQSMRSAIFNSDLHLDQTYTKIETIGSEEADGHTYYKVQLTPASGFPIVNFYDKETGLLVKNQTKAIVQGGEVTVESASSDWKEVDGVKMPHVTSVKAMGVERRIVIDKIEQNVTLPADAFEPPAEVKELRDKPKKAEPAKNEAPTAPDKPKPQPEQPK